MPDTIVNSGEVGKLFDIVIRPEVANRAYIAAFAVCAPESLKDKVVDNNVPPSSGPTKVIDDIRLLVQLALGLSSDVMYLQTEESPLVLSIHRQQWVNWRKVFQKARPSFVNDTELIVQNELIGPTYAKLLLKRFIGNSRRFLRPA